MRRKTITSVLVTAAVLLVLVGASPEAAAAEPSLPEIMQQHDLAVFEWNRLSQVNTMVTAARLDALRVDGFKTIYVDISEYVEVADQQPSPTWQARLTQLNNELKGFVDRYNQVVPPDPKRLQLGVAIPFRYDGTPDVPAVQFGDSPKTAPAAFHLIDMLGTNSRAYVLVMAYRNFASDEDRSVNADGSIALVSGEFDYVRRSGATCGIVIGQEFGKIYPQKVSFGWVGRAAFRHAAGELVAAYGGRQQFRGLSVNDLDAYETTPE
jgi:hypothetical protein